MDGKLPTWLDPQTFLAPEFDADNCVGDLRRYVSAAGSGGRAQIRWAMLLHRRARQAGSLVPRRAVRGIRPSSALPTSTVNLPTARRPSLSHTQAPLVTVQTELENYLALLKHKVRERGA